MSGLCYFDERINNIHIIGKSFQLTIGTTKIDGKENLYIKIDEEGCVVDRETAGKIIEAFQNAGLRIGVI